MDAAALNEKVIEQFRAGGPVDGMHRDRLVLLTTIGRRTGEHRTAPMMFHSYGDTVLVVASANAAPRHPEWFLNLVADPHVHLETPDDSYDAVARVLDNGNRAAAWKLITRDAPFFDEHQSRVKREIPVVELIRSPISAPTPGRA